MYNKIKSCYTKIGGGHMKQETELKGIRIPKDLIKKIETSAEKETRTFSAQVIHIIKSYYDMQEKK